MRITVREYKRRDGSWMVYINGDNGASVGVSADWQPSAYGLQRPRGRKVTQGQRNVIDAFFAVVKAMPEARVADDRNKTANCGSEFDGGHYGRFVITDIGRIDGWRVRPGDGLYMVRKGSEYPDTSKFVYLDYAHHYEVVDGVAREVWDGDAADTTDGDAGDNPSREFDIQERGTVSGAIDAARHGATLEVGLARSCGYCGIAEGLDEEGDEAVALRATADGLRCGACLSSGEIGRRPTADARGIWGISGAAIEAMRPAFEAGGVEGMFRKALEYLGVDGDEGTVRKALEYLGVDGVEVAGSYGADMDFDAAVDVVVKVLGAICIEGERAFGLCEQDRIYVSPGLEGQVDGHANRRAFVADCVARFERGDFGVAVEGTGRGFYGTFWATGEQPTQVWVSRESDADNPSRSCIFVCLPSEQWDAAKAR